MGTTQPLSSPAGPDKKAGDLIIAVAGNPNAGKSTLINAIAGSRLHVGNWPGVTVEKSRRPSSFRAGASHSWICRAHTV
jgi:ribosome biogenesis GTPase A